MRETRRRFFSASSGRNLYQRGAITLTVNLELAEKVVFVAASSKGLGREVARRFLEEGAYVTISSRSRENVDAAKDALLSETGVDEEYLLATVCDVTDSDAIESAVANCVARFGGLDVLVNNHGGPPAMTFDEATDEEWDDAYELVVKSNIQLARAALPDLIESDHGAIITVSSASARESPSNHALSNVFRLGLYGLTKTLAREYAPDIRANVVAPRFVMTDRIRYKVERRAEHRDITVDEALQSRTDEVLLDRPGSPKEFADAVAFVASPRASYTTGDVIRVDGGWTRGAI